MKTDEIHVRRIVEHKNSFIKVPLGLTCYTLHMSKLKSKRILKLAPVFALMFVIAIAGYLLEREGYELRRKAQGERTATLMMLPQAVVADPGDEFDIAIWLNTVGKDVVGVDIILEELSLLEIVEINPDYTHFPTFVPVNDDGSFDQSTAISDGEFGAVTFDWNSVSDPITSPVKGAAIRLGSIKFRALSEGNTSISIRFDGEDGDVSTADSNVVMIDTGDNVLDVLKDPSNADVSVMIGQGGPPVCIDDDGDGFKAYDSVECRGGVDCDDTNASIHPGAYEDCNGIDDNCNNQIDERVERQCYGANDCLGVQRCVGGQWTACDCDCVPNCAGKECGSDGCGGDCGFCPAGEICRRSSCLTVGELYDIAPKDRPDGRIDIFDLSVVLSNWRWKKVPKDEDADVNQDGTVNIFDLSLLLVNWSD